MAEEYKVKGTKRKYNPLNLFKAEGSFLAFEKSLVNISKRLSSAMELVDGSAINLAKQGEDWYIFTKSIEGNYFMVHKYKNKPFRVMSSEFTSVLKKEFEIDTGRLYVQDTYTLIYVGNYAYKGFRILKPLNKEHGKEEIMDSNC